MTPPEAERKRRTPLVLVLGGTAEASALVASLAGDRRVRTLLSLAGATRAPAAAPVPCRVGGFGGADGLADFLRAHAVAAVVDATHPFAVRISRNAREASAAVRVPLVRLTRPPWRPEAGDRWTEVTDAEEASRRLGAPGRRVLLTIGRLELAPFLDRPYRFVVRSVDPPPPGQVPRGAVVIAARGPFRLEDECALFRRERVEVLVTKNAGGAATGAKLQAARLAGAEVIMIRRPKEAEEEDGAATDVAEALARVAHACLGA